MAFYFTINVVTMYDPYHYIMITVMLQTSIATVYKATIHRKVVCYCTKYYQCYKYFPRTVSNMF